MPVRRIRKTLQRLHTVFEDEGPVALISELRSAVLYRLHIHVLDRLFGHEEPPSLARVTKLSDLTVTSSNATDAADYGPTPFLIYRWIRKLLPEDVTEWTFVDIGAGRGRVVAMAAMDPYRRVLGVEFAEELYRDADHYISCIPEHRIRARDVAMLHADATEFAVPDGPCIFYLFHPFDAAVLRRFLVHVLSSLRSEPRPMILAYFNPKHGAVLDEFPELSRRPLPVSIRLGFAALGPRQFEIYACEPAAPGQRLARISTEGR